jgi:hypothetical protein
MFNALSSTMAGSFEASSDGGISSKQLFYESSCKFFFGDVIGFRALQSFVVMNESLNMSFFIFD